MRKTGKRNSSKAARVKKVAEIAGVSERFVYQVLNSDRESEEVMRTYMFLYEGENELVEAAKKLVPFE